MWRKGNPFALLVEMQTGAATVESSMETPQKIKNGFVFWPSDPTSGNISKGTQNTNSKEHKHPYVHCGIIYNCQDTEAAQVSISRRVDKMTMRYLRSRILLSHKKEENFTLCNSRDGPGEGYAKERNQQRNAILFHSCGIWWTNWTNEENGDRLIDGEQTIAIGRGG